MTILESLRRRCAAMRGLWSGTDGSVAVEMAVAAPLLLILVAGTFDFGRAMQQRARLESAAAAGVLHGSRSVAQTIDATGIDNAVRADAGDTQNALAVASRAYCTCSDGAEVACSTSCGTGTLRYYVEVTVQSDYHPLFPYPFVPATLALQGRAAMRAQ